VTSQPRGLAFQSETDLENYLLGKLSLLLSLLGEDLLIIGKQVTTAYGRRIDLLAIDATGAIHIIELKLGGTTPEIVGQVTDYLYWVRQLTMDEIIRVAARAPLCVNLRAAFQEHFGHPLPETVNRTQGVMIIALAIDAKTQRSMLAIRHPGLSTTMFRYAVKADALILIPCCRDGQDKEATQPVLRPPFPRSVLTVHRAKHYTAYIHCGVREFWQSQDFVLPVVLAAFVYALYVEWVHEQVAEGWDLTLQQDGQFHRQLTAITAESGQWAHVNVPTGISMETLAALPTLPSTRTKPAAGYQTTAYMRAGKPLSETHTGPGVSPWTGKTRESRRRR
jgi:hypothetical protein